MTNDLPRVILIDSDSITGISFICGFVSLNPGNTNGISSGSFYLSENGDLPYILYSENETIKSDSVVQSLPPFIFYDAMPKEINVIFSNQAGKQSPKVRVTATMGHPNDDLPVLYQPRPFILKDQDEKGGSGAVTYGFLMDVYYGDQINCEIGGPMEYTITLDQTSQISEKPVTNIFIFPVNAEVLWFTLNLESQGLGSRVVDCSKAPTFYTIDQ